LQKYAPAETKRLGLQTLSQIVGAINDKLAPHASGAAPLPPDAYDAACEAEIEIAKLIGEFESGKYRVEIVRLLEKRFVALAAPATGKLNLDYSQDLRHDLRDEEFALQYILACAKEGEATLRIGLRELRAALAAPDIEKLRTTLTHQANPQDLSLDEQVCDECGANFFFMEAQDGDCSHQDARFCPMCGRAALAAVDKEGGH